MIRCYTIIGIASLLPWSVVFVLATNDLNESIKHLFIIIKIGYSIIIVAPTNNRLSGCVRNLTAR